MKSSSRAHDKDLQSLTDAYTNIMESRDQSNNIKHTQDQAYKQGKYDFGAGVTGSQAKLESKKFGNFSEQYIRGRSDAREEFGRPPEPKEAPVSDEDRNEMEGIIFGDKEMIPEENEKLVGEEYEFTKSVLQHAISYLDTGSPIDTDSGDIRDDDVDLNDPEAVHTAAEKFYSIIELAQGTNLGYGDNGLPLPNSGRPSQILYNHPKIVGICLARALWKVKSANLG